MNHIAYIKTYKHLLLSFAIITGAWMASGLYIHFSDSYSPRIAHAAISIQGSVELKAGWNMIAHSGTDAPLSALSGCQVQSGAWWWNGSEYRVFDQLRAGYAYWVKVGNDCTATLGGGFAHSEKLPINKKWNMVGVPGKSWNQVTDSCPVLSNQLYWWNGAEYLSLDVDEAMAPGIGYFVYASDACEVDFNKLLNVGDGLDSDELDLLNDDELKSILEQACSAGDVAAFVASGGLVTALQEAGGVIADRLLEEVGGSVLNAAVLEPLLGPALAEQLGKAGELANWLKNNTSIDQSLITRAINGDQAAIDSIVNSFVEVGTNELEKYAVSHVESMFQKMFGELDLDPVVAEQIGAFAKFAYTHPKVGSSLQKLASLTVDEFNEIASDYIVQQNIPIIKNITDIKEISDIAERVNATAKELEQIAHFAEWLTRASTPEEVLTMVEDRFSSEYEDLKNQYNAALNGIMPRLDLSRFEAKDLLEPLVREVLVQNNLDPYIAAEVGSFIETLDTENVKHFEAIGEVAAQEFDALVSRYEEIVGSDRFARAVLNSMIDPIADKLRENGVHPDIIIETSKFASYLINTKNISPESALTQVRAQLAGYLSLRGAEVFGVDPILIKVALKFITGGEDILSKLTTGQVMAAIDEFIRVEVNTDFQCPINPTKVAFWCHAFDGDHWRKPELGTLSATHGAVSNDLTAEFKIGGEGVHPVQYEPCDTVPGVRITLFPNDSFRQEISLPTVDLGPLTYEGGRLWVDAPTQCYISPGSDFPLRDLEGRARTQVDYSGLEQGIEYIYKSSGNRTASVTCNAPIDVLNNLQDTVSASISINADPSYKVLELLGPTQRFQFDKAVRSGEFTTGVGGEVTWMHMFWNRTTDRVPGYIKLANGLWKGNIWYSGLMMRDDGVVVVNEGNARLDGVTGPGLLEKRHESGTFNASAGSRIQTFMRSAGSGFVRVQYKQ